jgi:excisionase family DNA binding protein
MENELRVESTTTAELIVKMTAKLRKDRKEDLDYILDKLNFKAPEEYLTRNEVSQMLKVDLSTIYIWTKDQKLIRYKLGKRVYYKRSEIEDALVEIRTSK